VISLLEAEHPDVEGLAKEVVIELKTMWQAQDHYVIMMVDPSGKRIYTFGVYYTQKQAEKDLFRLSSPGPGPSRGWVQKIKGVPDAV
jgi:hypothetical protein